MKEYEYEDVNDCLIMRIKKLKEQVKNLLQQVIGDCILAFTKNKREMTKDELREKIEEWGVEEIIVLEPQEDFNCGIIGITEDKSHLVYSYTKLTEGLAEKYFKNKKLDDERTFEDCLSESCEWVDYNTIRQLPYMNAGSRPIIIYEF